MSPNPYETPREVGYEFREPAEAAIEESFAEPIKFFRLTILEWVILLTFIAAVGAIFTPNIGHVPR